MHRYDRRRRALALALTGLAGGIDAMGFLATGGYFVSFMSGNTTRLGVDLARQSASAWIPALLIAGFVAGVALGSLVAGAAGRARKVAVVSLVAVVLANAALAGLLGRKAAMLGALVLAMGAINNTFQRNGETSVGLTYMTGALVRVGQSLAGYLAGSRRDDGRGSANLLLWAALAGGAAVGAFIWSAVPALALWLVAAVAGALAVFAGRIGEQRD